MSSKGDPGINMSFAGSWDAGVPYQKDQCVTYDGNLWLSLLEGDNIGDTPDDQSLNWRKVVSRGFQGYQGYQGTQGFQGIPGMNLAYIGEWNEFNEYNEKQLVSQDGSVYVAVQFNQNVSPNTDLGAYWKLFLSRGSQGLQGQAGPPGVQGPAGYIGPQGNQGQTGVQGPTGSQGPQGYQGFKGDEGNQGIPGPQGANGTNLPYLGDWDPDRTYGINDLVTYNGSTWYTKIANQGSAPTTSNSNWGLYVERGDQGIQGPQGFQGVVGAQGPQGFQGNAGRDGVNPRGFWQTGEDYGYDDLVTFNGSTWICISSNISDFGNTPPTDGSQSNIYWSLFASQGEVGPPGAGLTFNGDWLPEVGYEIYNLVTYFGTTYYSRVSNPTVGIAPPNNPDHWTVFVSKGDAGPAGGGNWYRIDCSAPVGGYTPDKRVYTCPAGWSAGPASVAPYNTYGFSATVNDLVVVHDENRFIASVAVFDHIQSGPTAGYAKLADSTAFSGGLKGNLLNTAFRLAGFSQSANPLKIFVCLAD